MIGLDLDNDPANAIDQHGGTDQIVGDVADVAVEKGPLQSFAQPWCGRFRHWSHSR